MIRQNVVKAYAFVIIILTVCSGTFAWYFKTNVEEWYAGDMQKLANEEWYTLEAALYLTYGLAKSNGETLRSNIQGDIDLYVEGSISESLDNYLEPNNQIRKIINDTIGGYYFMGIISDSTDPFVTLGESIVYDESGDCSTLGSFRTFEEEYPMHANPVLAQTAFYSIGKGIQREEPIFFQFLDSPIGENIREKYSIVYDEYKDKKALILSSYNIKGLKDKYMENYNWEDVFESLEFIAPTYMYEKSDIAGRAYIENGRLTSLDRLSINVGFNFQSVINNVPSLKIQLERFDWSRENSKMFAVRMHRVLVLLVLLFGLISMLTMAITVKILEIDERVTS